MNIFKTIWYKIVGEPSVAKAVKNIDKAIAKLEGAVTFHAIKQEMAIKAQALMAKAEADAVVAKEHAARVVAKMKELLA